MITTEAHFHKIRAAIKSELLLAKHTVFVAVAWFTDPILFNTLLQIAENGVHVSLCIVSDSINFGSNELPFSKITEAGGKFCLAHDDRMHHKFCVIDNYTVITGSYNWTVRASMGQKNENIIVTKGDAFLANQFIKEFYAITGQKAAEQNADISVLVKRCKVIKELILLDDDEDIQKHTAYLAKEGDSLPDIQEIITALQKKNFTKAIEKIELLVQKHSTLTVYKDPLEEQLLFEIKVLEYQIIAVQNKKAEAEKIVFEYDNIFNHILGTTIKEYLHLKKKLAQTLAEENPANEEYENKYKEAEADYKQYDKAYEESKKQAEKINKLSDEDKKILKQLYRETSMLCHPDKYQNANTDIQKKAEELFKQLNDANQVQDIETVKSILEKLKAGILDEPEAAGKEKLTIAKLKTTVAELMARYHNLVAAYETTISSDAYKTYTEHENIEAYFEENKKNIEQEIQQLKQKLQVHEP